MDKLILFTKTNKNKLVNQQSGDSKFGNHVQLITETCNIYDQLKNLDVDYVLFGIPEDVGVFANHGLSGTYSAWSHVIKVLLNMQNNHLTKPERLLILGHLDFSKEQSIISNLSQKKIGDIKKARKIVEEMDKPVTQLMHDIIKAGKKPIVIGGGHNNAYGNIKGTSLALNMPINIINLDAHTDFRKEDGRHSGNAFSYAYTEGFLGKYFVFGIHENYILKSVFDRVQNVSQDVSYNFFEDLMIRKQLKFKAECKRALNFISNKPFGIEIDCDAIENIPSSAMTPSGFSANKTREFLHYFASHKNASYVHICEAAPNLAPKKLVKQSAKLISYLITDFMKV